jgi:molybdate transport system substrate-binding protein
MGDTVRVLSTLALKGAVERLCGDFEAAGGARIDADFAPTLTLLERLRSGEPADVVILTREGLDEVVREGRVAGESCVDLARSWVGIAVKAGAALTRISRPSPRCAQRYSPPVRWPIRGSAPAAFCSRS